MEERNEIPINSLAVLNELTTVGRALQLAETSQKYSKSWQTKTVNRRLEIVPKEIKWSTFITLYCAWAMNQVIMTHEL